MYRSSDNFHGISIVVSTLQNLLYSSLYQLTIYLHNVRSERFGMLAHSKKFVFLAAYTLPFVIMHLYCFYALKAMTTESKFGKISRNLHSAQTKLYDVHSVFISKDRAVSHCIRQWPRNRMLGILQVNRLKIEL